MNSSNTSQIVDDIPNRLLTDYIHIFILTTIFLPGICMNFYTFLKIYRRYKITESRIMLLNLQLNVTNTKILILFVFTRICWLATYKWMGGWFLCKAVKFGQMFSFLSSSNIVVCIGLDRLLSLLYPLQIKPKANRRCKVMILCAWTIAFACSCPQAMVWTVVEVTPSWHQCTDIWSPDIASDISMEEDSSSNTKRKFYSIFNLLVVSWIPFVCICVCYIIILRIVYLNSRLKSVSNNQQTLALTNDNGLSENQQLCQQELKNLSNNFHDGSSMSSSTVRRKMEEINEEKRKRVLKREASKLYQNCRQDTRTCILQNGTVTNRSRIQRSRKKAFKVSTLIIIAYTVCWLPYNVLATWNIVDSDSYSKVEDYVYWCYSLIALNTLINPLIYGPTKSPSFKNFRQWVSTWRVRLLSTKRSSKKASDAIAARRRDYWR